MEARELTASAGAGRVNIGLLPDAFAREEQIRRTSMGKRSKWKTREQYGDILGRTTKR